MSEPGGVPPEVLATTGDGPVAGDPTTRQIRGSTLLLVGRIGSLVFTMATQVVLVRSLSRSDYGVFAFVLALVSSARVPVTLGQANSLSRFLSIYDEKNDRRRILGVLILFLVTVIGITALLFPALAVSQKTLLGEVLDDPAAGALLFILVGLAPLEGLDVGFVSLFAVFSRPRFIFFRKYVFTPVLRLAVVLALTMTHQSTIVLAWGYLLTGVLGIGVYAWAAVPILRDRGVLAPKCLRQAVLPIREVYGFSIPLLSFELSAFSMTAITAVVLANSEGAVGVAGYRAVIPAARLNQLVIFSFNALFVALASRLFARADKEGMRDAYWQTAVWLAVLSFPIFALTGPMAETTVLVLFGERYRDAVPVLAVLSLGFYFNAALGFNALTLQVFGRMWYSVTVNIGCAVINVALSLALIPRYGPLGAAAANCLMMVLMNVANQAGLGRLIGTGFFRRGYRSAYAGIAFAGAALWAFERAMDPAPPAAVAAAIVASVAVLFGTRRALRLGETFPELSRLPLARRLLVKAGPGARDDVDPDPDSGEPRPV